MQRRQFLIKSGIAAATLSFTGNTLADDATSRISTHERAGKAYPVLDVKGLKIGMGAPKIVASITGKNRDEVLQQASAIAASEQVDIAELRLDYLPSSINGNEITQWVNKVSSILEGKPLLATFRSKKEGGERTVSVDSYFGLYAALLQSTAIDLLDVEMMKPETRIIEIVALAHAKRVAVVLSNHDFESTPAHNVIIERLQRQQQLGGDILKLAAMPKSPNDVLTLMAATQEMHALYAQRPLLTMSMGPLGVASRLVGQLTGSALTYASIGSASAPGQLDAEAVRTVLGIMDNGSNS